MYYPKEELGISEFIEIANEDLMPHTIKWNQSIGAPLVILDMAMCNHMDKVSDEKPESGYGLAKTYLVKDAQGQEVILYIFGDSSEVLVTQQSNFFEGKMTTRALSLATQSLLMNHLGWSLYNNGIEKGAVACELSLTVRDCCHLEELGFSKEEVRSVYAFLD